MRYTTIVKAEAEGAYGFTSMLEMQKSGDGRVRIVGSGFGWHGNEGSVRGWHDGPYNVEKSAELLVRVKAATDNLDDDEKISYAELSEVLGLT